MKVSKLIATLQGELSKGKKKNAWIQQSCASDKQVLVVGYGTKEHQIEPCHEIDLSEED